MGKILIAASNTDLKEEIMYLISTKEKFLEDDAFTVNKLALILVIINVSAVFHPPPCVLFHGMNLWKLRALQLLHFAPLGFLDISETMSEQPEHGG